MDYRLVKVDYLPLSKVLRSTVYYLTEIRAEISVEQDWSASRKDGHNNKLSYNSEENPKLGLNYGYVRFLSNGIIVYFSLVEELTSSRVC